MNTLDLLYVMLNMQKISYDASPTYVEKKKLKVYDGKITKYKLEHLRNIKKRINDDYERTKESYLGWSDEYNKKQCETYNKYLDSLIQLVHEEKENVEDQVLHNEIEKTYGKLFLTSSYEEILDNIYKL